MYSTLSYKYLLKHNLIYSGWPWRTVSLHLWRYNQACRCRVTEKGMCKSMVHSEVHKNLLLRSVDSNRKSKLSVRLWDLQFLPTHRKPALHSACKKSLQPPFFRKQPGITMHLVLVCPLSVYLTLNDDLFRPKWVWIFSENLRMELKIV